MLCIMAEIKYKKCHFEHKYAQITAYYIHFVRSRTISFWRQRSTATPSPYGP